MPPLRKQRHGTWGCGSDLSSYGHALTHGVHRCRCHVLSRRGILCWIRSTATSLHDTDRLWCGATVAGKSFHTWFNATEDNFYIKSPDGKRQNVGSHARSGRPFR